MIVLKWEINYLYPIMEEVLITIYHKTNHLLILVWLVYKTKKVQKTLPLQHKKKYSISNKI